MSPSAHDYSGDIVTREEAGTPNVVGDIRAALAFLPERVLSAEEAVAVSHGRSVPIGAAGSRPAAAAPGDAAHADGEHFRLTFEGELVAVAEPRAAELKPVVVFAPA